MGIQSNENLPFKDESGQGGYSRSSVVHVVIKKENQEVRSSQKSAEGIQGAHGHT